MDYERIANGLGAKAVDLRVLTREEAKRYTTIGSPVILPWGDNLDIFYYGSRMLADYGKSLDDVVGYRILESSEEKAFRDECKNASPIVVRYYGKKEE